MNETNGKVAVEQAEAVSQAITSPASPAPAKLRLHMDSLTPRDLSRARVMLGGQDPNEVLASDDTYERIALMIWCLKSRTMPGFTWDDALDTPFGEFDMSVDEPPPPIGPGGSPGPEPEPKTANASKPKQPAGVHASN